MNTAHLHLLVNHLPIVGFAFGMILLTATILRRGDRGLFTAAVLVVVISGAGGLAAQFTGEPAEELVEHLADVPEALIEAHEGAALIATILASITTLLAIVISVVTLRREGRIGVIPLSILLVATVVTCGTMTWAGSTGGKIRHSEIRDSTFTIPSSDVKGDD
jgi:hypothetical protein